MHETFLKRENDLHIANEFSLFLGFNYVDLSFVTVVTDLFNE